MTLAAIEYTFAQSYCYAPGPNRLETLITTGRSHNISNLKRPKEDEHANNHAVATGVRYSYVDVSTSL